MLTYVSVLDMVYAMLFDLYQILLKKSKSCCETQARNHQLYRFFWSYVHPIDPHSPRRSGCTHVAVVSAEAEKYGTAVHNRLPSWDKMPHYLLSHAFPLESLGSVFVAFFGLQAPFSDMVIYQYCRPRRRPNPNAPAPGPPDYPL